MDCRAFRKRHLAFVDDTLPGMDVPRMQAHIQECTECAAWDHRIRRSLLVVRNHLGVIEPSADFTERLASRLERERHPLLLMPASGGMSWSSFAVAFAVVIAVGTSALALGGLSPGGQLARLPAVALETPVVADSASTALPNATPAFIATMSTGMAILPALMIAEELREDSQPDGATAVRAVTLTIPPTSDRR
jgi:hypothetical protein